MQRQTDGNIKNVVATMWKSETKQKYTIEPSKGTIQIGIGMHHYVSPETSRMQMKSTWEKSNIGIAKLSESMNYESVSLKEKERTNIE